MAKGRPQKSPREAGFLETSGRNRLLDFGFLVRDVLANRRIVLLGYHLFRMQTLVLGRRVVVTRAGTRHEAYCFATGFGH